VVQSQSGVIHVVADRLEDLTHLLARLAQGGGNIDELARCDEVRRPIMGSWRKPEETHAKPFDEDIAAGFEITARGSAHTPNRRTSTLRSARDNHLRPRRHSRPTA
jgi:hypothetical protein